VAVALVLALDSSASVDRDEFRLQIGGLAAAFRDPEVLRSIELLRPLGAAVAVVAWGNPLETRIVLPWTQLQDARDAKALAFRIGLIQRWTWASATSVVAAIDDSRELLEAAPYEGLRQIVDVSGDGSDNGGGDLAAARRRSVAAGLTVNGLPILADDPALAAYYRDQVIAGAGAFIEPALDYEDFARAIREKLLRELRPPES
jgi:hypothetical protein